MRFLIAALSIAGLLVSATVAKADKRVAFVVGNGAYKNVAALPNPPIDAKAIRATFVAARGRAKPFELVRKRQNRR